MTCTNLIQVLAAGQLVMWNDARQDRVTESCDDLVDTSVLESGSKKVVRPAPGMPSANPSTSTHLNLVPHERI